MNDAAQTLVIIVSAVLALFLLLAIVALIWVLKILRSLRRITEQAEKLVNSAEAAAEFFQRTSGPLSVMKTLASVVDNVSKQRRHKE